MAPDSGLTLAQLVEESSLEQISRWAAAVGPAKGTLVQWQPEEQPGADAARLKTRMAGAPGGGSGGGGGGGGGGGRYVSSGLVEQFHAHGLQVGGEARAGSQRHGTVPAKLK